jgi:hypothetical protein
MAGKVINRSSKVLWVVETDTGRASAHKLYPGKKSPRGVDADGVRSVDDFPISGHISWWKVIDISTAEIENGNSELIIDCLTCRKVDKNEFGDIQYDQSDNWGEPISQLLDSSMTLEHFLSKKRLSSEIATIFAYVFKEGDYYIIDPTPFERKPIYKIFKKYISVNLDNPIQIQSNYDNENYPIYNVSIQKDCPSIIKIETVFLDELIDQEHEVNRSTFSYLGIKTEAVTEESQLWLTQKSTAENSLKFWSNFLRLRGGSDNNQVLNEQQLSRLLTIIRAVSWVESKHGSGSGNEPAKDPMQIGNPNDQGWKQFTGQTSSSDRFVTGPGGGNYDTDELPEAVEALSNFPQEAKFSHLSNRLRGHQDSLFNAVMSYYWSIPLLIHKINTGSGLGDSRRTYKCGDCSKSRLVDGAVAYNGGGDPQYRSKIENAITLIGWV